MKKGITQAVGLTLLISTITPASVFASGFRVPEISTVGTGTSNALVANSEEIGALPYNPAAMAFHEGKAITAGITYIGYDLKVNPDGAPPADSIGDDSFFVPNLYFMAQGYGNWSFGFGINAPFGLETKWQAGTFPGFGIAPPLEPALSRIEMINVNPNFAYKIDKNTSFAFGIDFYDVRDVALDTQGIQIRGDGSGFGFNLGYMKKWDDVTLGISYRSAVDTDISGTFDATNAGSPPMIAAETELEFPDLFQIGLHYQATENFGVELDFERTGWSSFDTITISNPSQGILTTSVNNWDDSWAYRLGAIYKLNSKTKLLFGYSFDETPQPDQFFSARVPDDDRQLFSIGVTHDFGSWNLEAAYMHVVVDDRDVNSTTPFIPPGDPNGTDAYNGVYESEVNLLSLGATMTF